MLNRLSRKLQLNKNMVFGQVGQYFAFLMPASELVALNGLVNQSKFLPQHNVYKNARGLSSLIKQA